MDKYFEIKPDCALYKDYFAHENVKEQIINAYKVVCEKFGIETNKFYMVKDYFRIVPTENDLKKFERVMKKTNYGEFKKGSAPSKMWKELVGSIENFNKPKLFYYFDSLGHRWKERVFHVGNKVYCSIESDGEVSTPTFAYEMKASEFYRVIEGHEENH